MEALAVRKKYTDQDEITIIAVALRLPLVQARILRLLLSVPVVTHMMLDERLGLSIENARVAIHRIKIRLSQYGMPINSQYSVGYFLTPEDRERLHKIIDQFSTMN